MSGRTRRVACGDVALHVVEEGRGSPVLALHGFTGSGASMAGVSAALRARHRVLRPDLLGHGASDAPPELAAYAIESAASQLVRLLDASGVERAHVLGYSMGGRLGLALAVLHPERVASALLVGARAGIEDRGERDARIRDDERLASQLERDGLEAFVEQWMALPLFATQRQRIGANALAAARRERLANDPAGLAASLRGMGAGAQTPLFPLLSRVGAPVLLAVGADDLRFRAIAEALAPRLPWARVAVVPEAGHAAHLENPGAFARLALAFLAAADGPQDSIHHADPMEDWR